MQLREYTVVNSLEEADELLHKSKNNIILGGLLWLKMTKKQYNIGIDISKLDLDKIEEKEDAIEMGSRVTLRQLEMNPLCQSFYDGVLVKSVENIVGVQFRNLATLGGSVYSRFGFSEISTVLLALNAQVELYGGGIMSMESFIGSPIKKDIITKIIIPKNTIKASYQCLRKTETDFPILSVAISRLGPDWRIAIGARPSKAKLVHNSAKLLGEKSTEEDIVNCIHEITKEFSFGSNMRASEEYRRHLASILIKKGVIELCK